MQTCPRCSAENKDGEAACWNCWAPLEGGEVGAAPPAEEVPVQRNVPWKPIVGILVVLAIAFVAYQLLGASNPVQVARDYLDAKYNGRESLAQKVTAADTSGMPLLPELLLVGRHTIAEGQRAKVSGRTAEVNVQISFRINGDMVKDASLAEPALRAQEELKKPIPTRVILVKRGGKWKVDQAATKQRIVQDGVRRFRDDKAWVADILKGKPLQTTATTT